MFDTIKTRFLDTAVWRGLQRTALVLILGVTMTACSSSTTWDEEVLLHDGSKLIARRSQSYGGRHEIGQGLPIAAQTITFTMPGTDKTVTWKDVADEDVWIANFRALALDILDGAPYIVASPRGCLAYNKWGRPNPPYVFFKYDGHNWNRISLAEFPAQVHRINLTIDTLAEPEIRKRSLISAELVKKLNSDLKQEEFRFIARAEIKQVGPEWCPVLVRAQSGGWVSPDGPKAPTITAPTDPNARN